jgi:hypothetical protein
VRGHEAAKRDHLTNRILVAASKPEQGGFC